MSICDSESALSPCVGPLPCARRCGSGGGGSDNGAAATLLFAGLTNLDASYELR